MKQKSLPVFVLSVLLAACAPPPPAQRDPKPAAPAPPVKAGPTIPVTPPRVFDESLLRGKEFLLEAPGAPAPPVRDPDLGVLENDPAVLGTVEGFFREAAEGKLDKARLAPRWAAYLQNWALGFQQGSSPVKSLRAGRSLAQEGTVMVPVRLGLGEKTFSGWLVLVREGGGLLVSDVQIVEAAARTSPFDPEAPQEISSPSLR